MVVWGIGWDDPELLGDFQEWLGVTYPFLHDDGSVSVDYATEMAFPSAAFPQDWVIDRDGTFVYGNNYYELDEIVAAIERSL